MIINDAVSDGLSEDNGVSSRKRRRGRFDHIIIDDAVSDGLLEDNGVSSRKRRRFDNIIINDAVSEICWTG